MYRRGAVQSGSKVVKEYTYGTCKEFNSSKKILVKKSRLEKEENIKGIKILIKPVLMLRGLNSV